MFTNKHQDVVYIPMAVEDEDNDDGAIKQIRKNKRSEDKASLQLCQPSCTKGQLDKNQGGAFEHYKVIPSFTYYCEQKKQRPNKAPLVNLTSEELKKQQALKERKRLLKANRVVLFECFSIFGVVFYLGFLVFLAYYLSLPAEDLIDPMELVGFLFMP